MDEELVEPEDGEEEEEEFEDVEFCFGIPLPSLPEGLQPLECVILIKGLMMDTGQPTITALGSEGMSPWEAAGMLQMESARLIQGYVFGGLEGTGFGMYDEEEDE